MIADMLYWIDSFHIDGFRVDHAHGVPDDYWDEVSLALSDKPVFMLAEGEEYWLRNDSNFVATYSWQFHHAMNSIAKGEESLAKLDSILAKDRRKYKYGYHIYFTSNHDENSWAGTVFERLGDGHQAFAVLAATIDGMPLIYGGQEASMDKRLEFFEKDTIDWGDYPYAGFYGTLLSLKKRNKAMWNGSFGGPSMRINSSKAAYAFRRVKDNDELVVILNLSGKDQTTKLDRATGPLKNIFTGQTKQYKKGEEIRLKPWEYIVLSNR
jgi:glycosidase